MILRLNDPHIINLVDPHLPTRMNDLMRIQQNADMRDLPLLIIKKSQVARFRLL